MLAIYSTEIQDKNKDSILSMLGLPYWVP
jgi:hypothetical protein